MITSLSQLLLGGILIAGALMISAQVQFANCPSVRKDIPSFLSQWMPVNVGGSGPGAATGYTYFYDGSRGYHSPPTPAPFSAVRGMYRMQATITASASTGGTNSATTVTLKIGGGFDGHFWSASPTRSVSGVIPSG